MTSDMRSKEAATVRTRITAACQSIGQLRDSSWQGAEGGKRLRASESRAQPYFSIVTIGFGNAVALRRCIQSIAVQTVQDFEHIVVDGGSTDGTVELLSARAWQPDYFVSEPDTGIYNAINKGLSLAQGKYILLIHADDFLRNDALERAWETIESTKCDVALGDSIYIDKDGRPVAYKPARQYGEEIVLRGIVGPHEGAFVAADVYERVGNYDESYRIVADLKFFRNCIFRNVKFARIGHPVNYKLVGGDSFDRKQEFEENYRLLCELFPKLDSASAKGLLCLKNYKRPSSAELGGLYHLLSNTRDYPARLSKAIALSLVKHSLGDGPEESYSGERTEQCKTLLNAGTGRTIALCIGKIKGVSGGAERVLVDLANRLNTSGFSVWVVCSDGRAGFPFYRLNRQIRFIDINEPPLNRYLSRTSSWDLRKELRELVMRTPEQFLKLALAPKGIRQDAQSWAELEAAANAAGWHKGGGSLSAIENEIEPWLNSYGGNVLRWRNFLAETRPALIIPYMISCIPQVYLANRAVGSKLLLSNHNNPLRDYYNQDEWNPTSIDRVLRLLSVSSADRSHWLLPEYVSHMPPLCRRNAVVIGNPVQVPAHVSEYEGRERVVLAVGRLTEVKNFQLLIRAFACIAGQFPDWTVRIFGVGPLKSALTELVAELGLKETVELREPIQDIDREYSKASVFASTSTVEGFPLTVCEAMSFGLPVIGREKCSGISFLIQQNQNGILVDGGPNDVSAYSEQLAALLRDHSRRSQMSVNARRSVKSFSPDVIYPKWEAVVNELIDKTLAERKLLHVK